MLKLLHTTALAVATAATGFVTAPERAEAQSYQIDCAILLCLSGGWPASVHAPAPEPSSSAASHLGPLSHRCKSGVAQWARPLTLTRQR